MNGHMHDSLYFQVCGLQGGRGNTAVYRTVVFLQGLLSLSVPLFSESAPKIEEAVYHYNAGLSEKTNQFTGLPHPGSSYRRTL